jgi:predicted RNase H-like HicB family nuclease
MKSLQRTIKAVIRPGEESGYVAECVEIAVVTQGATLNEVACNLREAVALHLEGEDLQALGLANHPTLLVTNGLPSGCTWAPQAMSRACSIGKRETKRKVALGAVKISGSDLASL